jgi:hypothetical protein
MMARWDWISAAEGAPRPPVDARGRRIIDNLNVEHEEMVPPKASSCQLGIKAFFSQVREPDNRQGGLLVVQTLNDDAAATVLGGS